MQNSESRRFRRVSLNLPARIVINDIDEYHGHLLNMSPGDLAVQVDTAAKSGDAAVIYVKGLDVVEGRIARSFPDGFALSFLLSKKRRALLAEQLTILSNPGFSDGLADQRNTLRHRNESSKMVCRLPDGASLFVKIIDMSVDGVSVDAPRRPSVGSIIHVGRARGTVVRHTPRGFVVVYDTIIRNTLNPALRAV